MRDSLNKKYKQSIYQKTIKKKASLKGVGLHTGVKSSVTFRPAEENSGIRFRRLDIDGCPEILANIDHVIGATKSTADNSTIATSNPAGLIIMLTSNSAGTDINNTSGVIDASTGASLTALSTDYTTNTAYTTQTYAHVLVERTDVRSAEAAVAAATSNAVAAVMFNRVAWLG